MTERANHWSDDHPPDLGTLIVQAQQRDADAKGLPINQCRDYLVLIAIQDVDRNDRETNGVLRSYARIDTPGSLRKAMDAFPDNHGKSMLMRHWLHKSFEEIAASTDRSVDATRKLWYRVIIEIRTLLKDVAPNSL